MKFISRKNLLLSLFVIINLICAFFLNYVGKHTLQTITIGSFEISSISVKGIFSAIQSLTCFMMVFINYRKGFVIALFLSLQALISSLIPVVRFHSLSSLPGFVSTIISVVSLVIIYSDRKSVV